MVRESRIIEESLNELREKIEDEIEDKHGITVESEISWIGDDLHHGMFGAVKLSNENGGVIPISLDTFNNAVEKTDCDYTFTSRGWSVLPTGKVEIEVEIIQEPLPSI